MPSPTLTISERFDAPTYAERYLRKKRVVKTENWNDLSVHEHAHAFTVAHSMKAAQLDAVLGLLVEAQKRGMPYKDFQKQFKALMGRKGWWKHQPKQGKKYHAWRTRLIYQTNMATAATAGAYRQQLQTAEERPYLVYKSRLFGNNRRKSHVAMHNVAYPVHHVFWDEHYPPNGWGCQCYVVSMDDEELEEYGIRVEDGIAANRIAASTPAEWKQNSGLEAIAPRFGDMKYLKQYPETMKKIHQVYAKDMRDIALTKGEFTALAKKLEEYGEGNQVPNVPVLVGAMNNAVWEAVQKKLPEVDVKLHGTTQDIAHAMRENKVHKVPVEQLPGVVDVMSDPDVVYTKFDKGSDEVSFWKEIGNENYIRVSFRRKNRKVLRLRTFSYFDNDEEFKKILRKGILYEKNR